GKHPYDLGYYLDYHRPAQPIDATHACVIGHNGTSTGWPAAASPNPPQVNSDFGAAALTGYKMDLSTSTYALSGTCNFLQQTNGAAVGRAHDPLSGSRGSVAARDRERAGAAHDQRGAPVRRQPDRRDDGRREVLLVE